MAVKIKFPVCADIFSFYEEKPEMFLDEADVDSSSYHNILDISHSQHRIVRVIRGSNKKNR